MTTLSVGSTTEQIAIQLGTENHVPLRIKPDDFGDLLKEYSIGFTLYCYKIIGQFGWRFCCVTQIATSPKQG